ncbi:MAG: HlyC/CorC family transporter [Burkholderiales bacterium]
MDDVPLGILLAILAVLLVVSGLFSMAETSMMALSRFRLKHLVAQGHRGARLTANLLAHTDRLLGVLLLGNNFINAAAASIVTVLTVRLIGTGRAAITVGTLLVTLAILVFSEITPKILGATYPEKIALKASYVLVPLLRLFYPVIWFINLFVKGLLWLGGVRTKPDAMGSPLSLEELRILVLEGGHFIPPKHQNILLNLLGLKDITVDDVMTPRSQIEGIDLESPLEEIQNQLATSNHTLQLLYSGSPDEVAGVVHVRKVFNQAHSGELTRDTLHAIMQPAYFIPAGTPLLTQLQNFQENRSKVALVVDEYGELQGLVTVEDIVEEIVGEFSDQSPHHQDYFTREGEDTVLVEGVCPLRDLNRKLGTKFRLDGPKTLNGLILETLEDIPEPGTALKIDGHPVEIIQTQDRMVRVARVTLKLHGVR